MTSSNPYRTFSDMEDSNVASHFPYTPLLDEESDQQQQPLLVTPPAEQWRRRTLRIVTLVLTGLLIVGLMVASTTMGKIKFSPSHGDESAPNANATSQSSEKIVPLTPLGVSEGVSLKSFRWPLEELKLTSFEWTSKMLAWQRTSFHFQPEKNWMNDPNGPLFYKGWYHLFYQYNPDGAVWGNKIVWGHAVSKDLIKWRHLPMAMVTDQWYDVNGVWTGSATVLPDGRVIILYTGSTNGSVQVQNLAYPADPSDSLLVNWVKYSDNPILFPPPGIGYKDFRDPTTAWLTPEGKWRITIGSKINKTGIALVYETEDFKRYTLLKDLLHAVPGTGMWECVDFYPVSKNGQDELDTSVIGGVKHVVKASLDDDRHDYYALGTYDPKTGKWVPDDPKLDVGIGLRYDYGTYYASKTFYDPNKKRRVLWSWIKETDSEITDVKKGWASVQGIPRTILFDKKTGSNIIQWPVEEIEEFRSNQKVFDKIEIKPGTVVPLKVGPTTQLDINAEFEVDKAALVRVRKSNVITDCRGSGAADRGALGPFGLLILADNNLTEQTPIYFYITKSPTGNLRTLFCADHTRSSVADDVDKSIYGSTVPVLKGEKLMVRILVDHSIVESFAMGGRTCITSRVYPTMAIEENAKLFLFNNATDTKVTASINIWQLDSAAYTITPPSHHLIMLAILPLVLYWILL